MTGPLTDLAEAWREDAEVLRRRGASGRAALLESCADELEAAVGASRVEAVTLEEASEIGGYSYSHLQHLVAEEKIPNVGKRGEPRIRRCDVPVKPGHGRPGPKSKTDLLDRSLQLHREEG